MLAPLEGDLEQIEIAVEMKAEGPRLLLVDSGLVFRGASADYLPVPNQSFVIESEHQILKLEALPLKPLQARPTPGSLLKVLRSNDPGVLSILRVIQHIESQDVHRLKRYLKEEAGIFKPDTPLHNRDVSLLRWISWQHNSVGVLKARLDRDPIRFALFAVTANYTIRETADWLRLKRGMKMEAAVEAAQRLSICISYLLERARLNYRVFSPEYADYHFNRGVQAYRRGALEEAREAFEEALKRNPDLVEARYNVGVTQYRAGLYKKAASAFLLAAGQERTFADLHYNRAATLYRIGKKLNAARSFRRVLKQNPRDKEAQRWLKQADPEGKTAPKKPKKRRKRRRGKRR